MKKTTKKTKEKFDLEATVTDKIIKALESGIRPWQKPWVGDDSDGLPLNSKGKPYRGMNIFMLWMEQMIHSYTSRYWLTMLQANELGGRINKGEKSSIIIFAKPMEREVEDDKDPTKMKKIKFWYNKYHLVWNADQISGLPERFTKNPEVDTSAKARLARIDHAEVFFAKTGSRVKHGGNRAYFSPSIDFIGMPEFNAFKDAESYYATLAHEHVHWTGHESRLDRKFGSRSLDADAYAKEELVAEIGAAICCAGLGIESNLRDDHAAYVANWLKALKDDKKLIFVAASKAQKAVDFLAKFSETVEEEKAEETQVPDIVEEVIVKAAA